MIDNVYILKIKMQNSDIKLNRYGTTGINYTG